MSEETAAEPELDADDEGTEAESRIYSDPSSEEVETHWAQSVYRMILDRNPTEEIKPNFDSPAGNVTIAMPEMKVGIATEYDDTEGLVKDGWMIVTIPMMQMQSFHEVASKIRSATSEAARRRTFDTVKTTSKPEQKLIDALLAKGVRAPDRNYKIMRDNGTELTTPDMVWEDIKLAFFVDGVWWHNVKDNKEMMKMVASKEGQDQVISHDKHRMERDTENRAKLTEDGWTVLACTDTVLQTDKGVQEQVARIRKTMKNLKETLRALQALKDRNESLASPVPTPAPQPREKGTDDSDDDAADEVPAARPKPKRRPKPEVVEADDESSESVKSADTITNESGDDTLPESDIDLLSKALGL